LHQEKFGFWVWLLSWVLYPKPKPKNVYTQTQNPKIFILKPKTQKYLHSKKKVLEKVFDGGCKIDFGEKMFFPI
jgi:hypothetical protein